RQSQEPVEQAFDVGLGLITRFLIGIGNVDRRRPADLIGARPIAVHTLGAFAVIVEIAHDRLGRAIGLQIGVLARWMRRPFDRLHRAGGWRPDRRVWLLIRA